VIASALTASAGQGGSVTIQRWSPSVEVSEVEQRILKRLTRVRKLFGFLRLQRHNIIDEAFEEALAAMYRDTGAGAPPAAPGLLCMVVLLQAYMQTSDAEAVELSVMDRRWQLVLDRLDEEKPAFSQGALQNFRERLIAHDLDRRLLERTVELARATKEFDAKKLPKGLRVGMDSRPLEGAGRVEDTFNLLGHAGRKIAECAADMTGMSFSEVCEQSKADVLLASSVKAGLDVDWSDPEQKAGALETLVVQVRSLVEWVARALSGEALEGPITKYIEALQQVQDQNLEEDDAGIRMRQGVAPDRRVSIEDSEMRHGRKTKNKRFNGYKEHQAADLDNGIVLACTVAPANQPEEQAGATLKSDIERQGLTIKELKIDRGYINSPIVDEIEHAGGDVTCKPWSQRRTRNMELFSKSAFKLDMETQTITCPAGEVEHFEPGSVVEFDPDACGPCPLRSQCTSSASRGRTVSIAEDEERQVRLRILQSTKEGREKLRERTGIEHSQAHTANRKGDRARYVGVRKNVFDLRRTAAVQNLELVQRTPRGAPRAAA